MSFRYTILCLAFQKESKKQGEQESKSYYFHLCFFYVLYSELLISHLLFEDYLRFRYDYPNLTLVNASSLLIQNKLSFTFSSFCQHQHYFLAILYNFFTQFFKNSFYFSSLCNFWFNFASLKRLYSLTSFEKQSNSLLFCSIALYLFPRSSRSEYAFSNYFFKLDMICFLDLTYSSSNLFFSSNQIFSIRLISIFFSFQYLRTVIYFFNFAFSSMNFFNSSYTLFLLSCYCQYKICFSLNIFSLSGPTYFELFFSLVSVQMRYLSVIFESFFLYSPSSSVKRSTSAIHFFYMICLSCFRVAISYLRFAIVECTKVPFSFAVESNFAMFSLFQREVQLSIYYQFIFIIINTSVLPFYSVFGQFFQKV